jgi:hypothetical protein
MLDHDETCAKIVRAHSIACDVACDCGYEGNEAHATDYALIVSFPDQSETFVLGFEAGMIWERLQAGETEIDVNVHTLNIEVLNRMCLAAKVTPKFQRTNVDGWTNLSIKPGARKPDLRLVKP